MIKAAEPEQLHHREDQIETKQPPGGFNIEEYRADFWVTKLQDYCFISANPIGF